MILIGPGGLSLDLVFLVGSEILIANSSETADRCSSVSMCLEDGMSPLQYLCHMFRYADSRPSVKFIPSQTEDVDIRSRRDILKFESAVVSVANCSANFTYSSSFLATRCPKPAAHKGEVQLK